MVATEISRRELAIDVPGMYVLGVCMFPMVESIRLEFRPRGCVVLSCVFSTRCVRITGNPIASMYTTHDSTSIIRTRYIK